MNKVYEEEYENCKAIGQYCLCIEIYFELYLSEILQKLINDYGFFEYDDVTEEIVLFDKYDTKAVAPYSEDKVQLMSRLERVGDCVGKCANANNCIMDEPGLWPSEKVKKWM